MATYEEIRQSIKDSGRLIFWYDAKGKLLVVDSSKSASRKKLLKTKYEGETYRLAITFHTGTHFGQGGQLAVHCRKFIIEDNKIIKVKGDKNGTIWFEKDWLETRRKWDELWLDIIINRLINNFNFGIGIYRYHTFR
jgi:hypothetical protein